MLEDTFEDEVRHGLLDGNPTDTVAFDEVAFGRNAISRAQSFGRDLRLQALLETFIKKRRLGIGHGENYIAI